MGGSGSGGAEGVTGSGGAEGVATCGSASGTGRRGAVWEEDPCRRAFAHGKHRKASTTMVAMV